MKTLTSKLSTITFLALSSTAFADGGLLHSHSHDEKIIENLAPQTVSVDTQPIVTITEKVATVSPKPTTKDKIIVHKPASNIQKASNEDFADTYIGAQYTFSNIDLNSSSDDLDINQLGVHAGVKLTDWLSTELRYSFGVSENTFDNNSEFELKNSFGAYALLGLPLDKYFGLSLPVTPYLIAGFTVAKLESNSAGAFSTQTQNDFSYGAGISLNITHHLSTSLEYISLLDTNNIEMDGINLRLSYTF